MAIEGSRKVRALMDRAREEWRSVGKSPRVSLFVTEDVVFAGDGPRGFSPLRALVASILAIEVARGPAEFARGARSRRLGCRSARPIQKYVWISVSPWRFLVRKRGEHGERSIFSRRAQRVDILGIEGAKGRFNSRAEAGNAVAHASAQECDPNARAG